MSAYRVLALDPIHEDGLAILRAHPGVELAYLPDPTPEAISSEMAKAQMLVLRGRHLPHADFERAAELRLVSRHGVGCDNLNLPWLKERGVGVAVAAESNLISVAEHAFTLMLAGAKNLREADKAVRTGDFARRGAMDAYDVAGRTVLVVGFGRIGRAFAARAAAFDADVIVYDPFLPAYVPIPPAFQRIADFTEALGAADVVSIHIPLSAHTQHLFGAEALAAMKPGALLVNTARGGIVDETALLSALDEGRPGRYVTDVFEREPPTAHDPLFARDDVILSPHSAAMTHEGVIRMATGSAQNVVDYIDGRLSPGMTVVEPLPLSQSRPGARP